MSTADRTATEATDPRGDAPGRATIPLAILLFSRYALLGERFDLTYYVLSLLLLLVNSSSPVYADQKLPLELRPYRVLLLVATDLPQQAGAGRSDLLEKILQAAGRSVGAQWELTVQEVDWLQPVSRDGLKRLTSAELYQRTGIDQDKFDVWLVASIGTNGAGFRIDVRGWQPAIEVDAGTIGRDIYDWHDIHVTTLQLSHASFRPIGRTRRHYFTCSFRSNKNDETPCFGLIACLCVLGIPSHHPWNFRDDHRWHCRLGALSGFPRWFL